MATVNLFCFRRYANFASVVVLPVPFIPRNTIRYGSPREFFSRIRSMISKLPAFSNNFETDSVRAPRTNSSAALRSTEVPTRRLFKSEFISSTTSNATSDWRSDISRSSRISPMSDSLRSFSAKDFVNFEKELRKLSNMSFTRSGYLCPGCGIHLRTYAL